MTFKPAIVIVAFNRFRSLERLLHSISKARYPYSDIPLIISIDRTSNNQNILDLAESFHWMNGTKRVVYQSENLDLRKHILECASYSIAYGSVIILEDDLFVSPNFYEYTISALDFAQDKPYISGVSLYSHQYNVHSRSTFAPISDGYDNWYMQFASSWGQAWTKNQWKKFENWYQDQDSLLPQPNIPENVTNWSDKSWLKYFIAFLVETNTYFLYPKISYTTNFSDAGTHIGKDTTTFQVPLDFGLKCHFKWSALEESKSVYDVFFENLKLYDILNLPQKAVMIDLYGKKPINNNYSYLLTDKILSYKILKSFGRSLKPHDVNIIAGIEGDDLFLYNTEVAEENTFKFKPYRKILYNVKKISRQEAKQVFVHLVKEALKTRFKKFAWKKEAT